MILILYKLARAERYLQSQDIFDEDSFIEFLRSNKMTPKEKFLKLVSDQETGTIAKAKARRQRRAYTHLSQSIALKILKRLEELTWSQKDLANAMGVSQQLVNKWVKGSENFTLETLANLQNVLETVLIAVVPEEESGSISSSSVLPAVSNSKVNVLPQ